MERANPGTHGRQDNPNMPRPRMRGVAFKVTRTTCPPIRNVPGTRSGPQRSERSRNGRNAAHQATSKRVQEAAEAQYVHPK